MMSDQISSATPAPSSPMPAAGETLPPAIELIGVNKSFGSVRANKNVNFSVRPGTIHGIVGENGAGKSTLMSILYGFYEADSGKINIAGKPVKIDSSKAAIKAGIGMVHQHFMLVEAFTVLENIMLGAEGGAILEPCIEAAEQKLKILSDTYGLKIKTHATIDQISVGNQQRVEILKALYRGAKVLILDEPTGVLTPQETNQLFKILTSLKEEGVTIILITHKLREIMAITDSVSVMRAGEMVAHRDTVNTSKEELAELMVGRKVSAVAHHATKPLGARKIEVNNVSIIDDNGIARLDDVSLTVHAGEIVGIAGVSGNGQSKLLEVLSGIQKITRGSVRINDREITKGNPTNPTEIRDLKVAHVPEDRHRMGLITTFSAKESCILGYHRADQFNKGMFLDQTAITQSCARLMETFDVRPRFPEIKSGGMSGGNQQKLILARELDTHPEVLLVGQPTRGVDIGAIEFIHQQLVDMRDAGCAILMVSVELDEIMALSDRILVMFDGRIVAEVAGDDADPMTLGLMMANAHDSSPDKSTQDKAVRS